MALLIGHRTCDLQIAGSSPGLAPLRNGLGQATKYLCASVTKQYNLVRPRRGRGDLFGCLLYTSDAADE